MDTTRKLAIATGVCFLITHVTSVPAAFLYDPILNGKNYVLGSGSDTQVVLGAFLELICALGIIGTSVSLFPVVRKWSEGGALGYVGLRTLEAGIIAVGVLPLLTVVTLRQHVLARRAATRAEPCSQSERQAHNSSTRSHEAVQPDGGRQRSLLRRPAGPGDRVPGTEWLGQVNDTAHGVGP